MVEVVNKFVYGEEDGRGLLGCVQLIYSKKRWPTSHMRTNTIIIQTKSTLQVRTELVPVLLHYLTIVIATLPATCRMRPCVCLVLTGLLASTLADQADLLTNTGSVAGLSKYAGIVNKNS